MSILYQNNRIRIRPYRKEDVDDLYACVRASIPEMKPYLPWVHDAYSRQDSENWVQWTQKNWTYGVQYDFVIEELSKQTLIGGVGLLKINPYERSAELGYWLHSEYAGQGITSEAAKLAVQYAKEELGLKRIIIYMSLCNIASQKIAQKLGAQYLETRKKYETVNGTALDCQFYELDLSTVSTPSDLAIFNK